MLRTLMSKPGVDKDTAVAFKFGPFVPGSVIKGLTVGFVTGTGAGIVDPAYVFIRVGVSPLGSLSSSAEADPVTYNEFSGRSSGRGGYAVPWDSPVVPLFIPVEDDSLYLYVDVDPYAGVPLAGSNVFSVAVDVGLLEDE